MCKIPIIRNGAINFPRKKVKANFVGMFIDVLKVIINYIYPAKLFQAAVKRRTRVLYIL